MSVIGTYARLDAADLERCRSNPGWLDELWEKKVPSAEVIDVDTAWHGIGWLMSQSGATSSPGGRSVDRVQEAQWAVAVVTGGGGTKEPQLQAPYGAAMSLAVDDVLRLDRCLAEVSPESLRAAFDGAAMDDAGVYPEIWAEEGPSAFDEYLLPNFEALRGFIRRAAKAGQLVLVFFT